MGQNFHLQGAVLLVSHLHDVILNKAESQSLPPGSLASLSQILRAFSTLISFHVFIYTCHLPTAAKLPISQFQSGRASYDEVSREKRHKWELL